MYLTSDLLLHIVMRGLEIIVIIYHVGLIVLRLSEMTGLTMKSHAILLLQVLRGRSVSMCFSGMHNRSITRRLIWCWLQQQCVIFLKSSYLKATGWMIRPRRGFPDSKKGERRWTDVKLWQIILLEFSLMVASSLLSPFVTIGNGLPMWRQFCAKHGMRIFFENYLSAVFYYIIGTDFIFYI